MTNIPPITNIRVVDETVKSLNTQIEEYLKGLIELLDISIEQFAEDYVIEQHPVKLEPFDVNFLDDDEVKYQITQKFRLRKKTDEEKLLEQHDSRSN